MNPIHDDRIVQENSSDSLVDDVSDDEIKMTPIKSRYRHSIDFQDRMNQSNNKYLFWLGALCRPLFSRGA